MYTKKLIRATWGIKEILSFIGIFVLIAVVFSFIHFHEARQDMKRLINENSVVSQEDIDKISVDSPIIFMSVAAAIAFGMAFIMQMMNLFFQVNVTRKHMQKAVLLSQGISSLLIALSTISVKLGMNLLFSKICTGDYAPLSSKFKDAAFNVWFFNNDRRISTTFFAGVAAYLVCVFAFTVVGTVIMLLMSRLKGTKIAMIVIGVILIQIGLIFVLIMLHSKIVTICIAAAMLVICTVAQYRLIKTHTLDMSGAIKGNRT